MKPAFDASEAEAVSPRAHSLVGRLRSALAFRPVEVIVLSGLALLVAGGAFVAWMRARPAASFALAEPVATVTADADQASAGMIVVHIIGAVGEAGVYELPAGARVIDAVLAAGGLGPKADVRAVNLARPLTDGEQIIVPQRAPPSGAGPSEGETPSGADDAGNKVNINTADQTALESLPGIGPAIAGRIIEYRETNGPFASVRDLLDVSGIGEKTLESLEPYVTV